MPKKKQESELDERRRAKFELLKRNKGELLKYLEQFRPFLNDMTDRQFAWLIDFCHIQKAVDSVGWFTDYEIIFKQDPQFKREVQTWIRDDPKGSELSRRCLRQGVRFLHNHPHPEHIWIVAVDLSRSKKSIMEGFESIIDLQQYKLFRGKTKSRLKWLSIIDEILQVWDMWEGYGHKRCFHLIAKKLNIPESTVKSRWRSAYKLIYKKEYTKEHAKDEAIQLCAKCKDEGKCYKLIKNVKTGVSEMKMSEPCAAYLKLAGPKYSREKLFENIEEIMTKKTHKDFLVTED